MYCAPLSYTMLIICGSIGELGNGYMEDFAAAIIIPLSCIERERRSSILKANYCIADMAEMRIGTEIDDDAYG